VALRDVDLPEKKNLVRMINSQNNERVFFADKAVLVEGMSDRLVVASLLEAGSARFANNEAIEIIEVGGKGNFGEYRRLLNALDTPSYIVADLDYLRDAGGAPLRALFRSDSAKAWAALREKKGLDSRSAIAGLRTALDGDDNDALRSFLAYLESRHARLADGLDSEQTRVVDAEIARLVAEKTLILEEGEIEDYLPPGVEDINAIVQMTIDREWPNRLPQEKRRVFLSRLICEVLTIEGAARATLLSEAERGALRFPKPLG
jgi:hypothetical protein